VELLTDDVKERRKKREFPPIPEEALYGWFKEYCALMAPTTEACAAYHLAVSLVYAGSLLGRTIHTTLAVPIYPNLYCCLVGETGKSRKDTAMSRGANFFTSGTQELYLPPFHTLTDVTSAEGLIDALDENATTLLYLTELSMLLRRARRQGTLTLMPMIIKLWDAPWRIDLPRAMSNKGAKSVEHPTVGVLAATTPGTLATDMAGEDIESGFANRVLWFFGTGGEPITDPPKPDAALSRRLHADLIGAVREYRDGTEITKDRHAKQLWDAWYLEDYHREYPSDDEARMAQRKGANILKVATLYAASEASPVIAEGHLAAATALVEWQFDTTREQSRRWGWGEGARLGTQIVECLQCDGPLWRAQISHAIGERHDPFLVSRTMKSLEENGRITQIAPGRWDVP
jgi:hypothetical protein